MSGKKKREERRVLLEGLKKSRKGMFVQLDVGMGKKKHMKIQSTMISHFMDLGQTGVVTTCFLSAKFAFRLGILEETLEWGLE